MSELTQDIVKELLTYNPDTGVLAWKTNFGRRSTLSAGYKIKNGRWMVKITGKCYYIHRIAWLYVYGCWPNNHIDHINGNTDDNSIENLRDVSRKVNLQNMRKATKSSKTGILGVSESAGRFRASIRINGKAKYLGSFDDAKTAHAAYVEAKRKYHEGCTI